ncbi:reverse transcriptase [Lithospermum erythrorhizon]|uniref:Reverse transcriptase n=1 Tax=Lithospermum erythrorhizon TaxID=34254 RepID=A0AAV3QR31_LITER
MDVFNELMSYNSRHADFVFHLKFKSLGITNICFADDLFIVCGATIKTMQIVNASLKEFEVMSSLKPNLDKNTVYVAGIGDSETLKLSRILGISMGNLPLRYLGIPLITKQLSYADCRPLIDGIRGKIEVWGMLISVMLEDWCLLILSFLENRIVGVCNAPSWHTGLVSWSNVNPSRKEVGLGIKGLRSWNKTCMALHMWDIYSLKESLWLKWILTYKHKGRCFWSLTQRSIDSWSWRQLIKYSKDVRRFVCSSVGNERSTNFWHDDWHKRGVLAELFTGKAKKKLRIPEEVNVWLK